MALTMEEKILGVTPEEKKDVKMSANYFTTQNIWHVSKKGCGVSMMNGRMVHEMLDYDAKKQVLAGKKEVKCGEMTFKLKK
jgi:hypothetical protein